MEIYQLIPEILLRPRGKGTRLWEVGGWQQKGEERGLM